MERSSTGCIGCSADSVPVVLPAQGNILALPDSMKALSGEAVPSVEGQKLTMFLVIGAGCPVCRRDLSQYYPDLIGLAQEFDLASRMIVLPASREEDAWILEHVEADWIVVLDFEKRITTALGVKVTPTVVVLEPNGSVVAAYAPAHGWPVTREMLGAIADGDLTRGG